MVMKLFDSLTVRKYYLAGRELLTDSCYRDTREISGRESLKRPTRTEILNFLLSRAPGKTCYLEIGVRNPDANFNHVIAGQKYSVDPGVEFKRNPVDFKLTSDEFFAAMSSGKVLSPDFRFDVIFIDGLHLAEQVDRDIVNALRFIKDDGFVVLHDCNPPTEWHARENYRYRLTPAGNNWNGTTWKAFLKWRTNASVHSCCIDSDWGVGILSKSHPIGASIAPANPFFEFGDLVKNRKNYLNLIGFDELKALLTKP